MGSNYIKRGLYGKVSSRPTQPRYQLCASDAGGHVKPGLKRVWDWVVHFVLGHCADRDVWACLEGLLVSAALETYTSG